ncbi:hypothetical protein Gotur_002493, partial [Gossypium turneri]
MKLKTLLIELQLNSLAMC